MSYILDALKRADAERGRGTVPGLHDQPMPGVASQRSSTHAGRRGWLAAAIVLVLAGIAAGAWIWRSQTEDDSSPAKAMAGPAQSPAQSQPAAAAAPVTGSAPQLAAPQVPSVMPASPIVPPAGVVPALPASPPVVSPPQPKALAANPVSPKPASAAAPKPKPRSEAAPQTPERSASAAIPATKPASSASAVKVATTIAPLLSELPEEIRRLIPALTITGAVYSENPAQRLLLVNGLVLGQGATAAPEVAIEEIRSRSATFTFRSSRFRITY